MATFTFPSIALANHLGFVYNGVLYEVQDNPDGTPNSDRPATPIYIVEGIFAGYPKPVAIIPQNSPIPALSPNAINAHEFDVRLNDFDTIDTRTIPVADDAQIAAAARRITDDSNFQDIRADQREIAEDNSTFGLSCSIGTGFELNQCIVLGFRMLVYMPTTGILAIAGSVFDVAAAYSLSPQVIDATFGDDISTSFVEKGWGLIRNLSNIIFIFLLLYIGIKTVLGLGDWKKQVLNIIIVALLINFSLFFTKIVIDASNLLALQFYNNIGSGSAAVAGSDGFAQITGFAPRSISTNLSDAVSPERLIQMDSYQAWVAADRSVYTLIVVFLVAAVINLALAFAFFSAAFLFIGRLIALWIIMITSPIAFIGIIFPQINKVASGKWVEQLTNQALVAPVFLFFIYIVSFIAGSSLFKIALT